MLKNPPKNQNQLPEFLRPAMAAGCTTLVQLCILCKVRDEGEATIGIVAVLLGLSLDTVAYESHTLESLGLLSVRLPFASPLPGTLILSLTEKGKSAIPPQTVLRSKNLYRLTA